MSRHSRAFVALLAFLFPLSTIAADKAYLVRDLPGMTVKDSMPWGRIFWTTIGNTTWFAALTEPRTLDIFKTDGTTAGTVRVTHGAGTTDRDEPTLRFLGVLGGKIIYGGRNASGEGVFALDTAGGDPVFLASVDILYLENAVVRGDILYFSAKRFTSSAPDLWRTDGTPAGTTIIDLGVDHGTFYSPRDRALYALGDSIFFFGETAKGNGLHRTDGTAANTTLLLSLSPSELTNDIGEVFVLGERLLFHLGGRGERKAGLWSTDGAAPVMIAEMSRFEPFEIIAGKLWFSEQKAIWTTDGTAAGTQKTDVLAGQNVSFLHAGRAVGEDFYFYAQTFEQSWAYKLYVTRGTAATTRAVMDLEHDGSLLFREGFVLGNKFYFRHDDGIHGSEIWMTDGTTTQLLADINPSYRRSLELLSSYVRPDGKVLFPAEHYETGREMWITDGTASGTRQLANLAPEDPVHGSSPDLLRASGERLFFRVTLAEGQAVGISDGTVTGTSATFVTFPSFFHDAVAANGRYFYSVSSGSPFRFFATDGSVAGTNGLHEKPVSAVAFARGVVFDDTDAIWFSDGTIAGTRVLQNTGDLFPAARLFSAGEDAWISHSRKLWKTDGTDAGTVEIVPADDLGDVFSLHRSGTTVYFLDSSAGRRLWRSDGTAAGTRIVRLLGGDVSDFIGAAGQKVYLQVGSKLLVSDGTDAGTIELPVSSPCYSSSAALGNALIFASFGNNNVVTLWRSDGTVEGTTKLATMKSIPNAPSQCPQLAVKGDVVYFSGWDTAHGRELWVTDGSVTGTRLFADIYPGTKSSEPRELTVAGDRVFFSADSPSTGRELWAVGEYSTKRRRSVAAN